MRIVVQFAPDAAAARIAERFPDVEVLRFAGGEPPAGAADAFLGGYADWDGVLRWVDGLAIPWVQLAGTGVDSVPEAVFATRTVTCARGASGGPISEWVLAAMFAHAKRFPESFVTEPPARWNRPVVPLDAIEGSTVGIVGLGGIGARVARASVLLGMRVKALRRTTGDAGIPGVAVVTSLDELLVDADHVVLAAPATARTRHMLDADAFARVKPGVHVVNIARGSLVDQDALRDALDRGLVARATLDVVTPEPLPAGHWMYTHPKVQLSPHGSWHTATAHVATIEIVCDNVERYRAGETLVGLVDRDEGY
jgi:phosphoglycerate dehydrogenase-like enzyme